MLTQRILMTADTIGGVWTYSMELARCLSRSGVETGLATMGERLTHAQRIQVEQIPGLSLFESDFALEWMDDAWTAVERAGRWLLDLETEYRPDVVHLNGYCHGVVKTRAPRVVVGHSCVLSWWRGVLGKEAPASYEQYRRRVTKGLDAAHRVVAPTAAMLEALRSYYGPLPRGRVIPNGISLESWPQRAKEPLVMAAGRVWDPSKNLHVLGGVATRITWPIYVAGSMTDPNGATTFIPNVRLLGQLPPPLLAERLSAASIFVHPARYEPFGLAPVEAATAGCALVLGDIESLREVWGDAAIFVKPDDVDEIAAALDRLAGDEALRLHMARQASERAKLYSVDRMATAYARLYDELVREARVSPARQSDTLAS